MNVINIIGRLTKDPETREAPSGTVAKFSVACDNDDRDKTTTFFNCTAFGKSAEFVSTYLTKGRLVAVSGSHKSNKGTDGNTYWNVEVNRVKGLDKPKDDAGSVAPRPSTRQQTTGGADEYDPFADE